MRLTTIALTASLIASSAGLTASALAAQNAPSERPSQRDKASVPGSYDHKNYPVQFVSGDKLRGASVLNNAGDSIGTISDLVIDRGSGYAPYVVVDTSNILGLGGRTVAVPYASFGWSTADRKPTLNYTKEQLEQLRRFDRDEWSARRSSDFLSDLAREFRQEVNDPYADGLDKARTTTIKGTVVTIDRENKMLRDDHTVLTVRTDDGSMRRVILGPSWYVTTRHQPLTRDKTVTIQAYEVKSGNEPRFVASWFNVDGQRTELRDSAGKPAWGVRSTGDASADNLRVRDSYVLLSELDGKDVSARGEDCGDVTDTIVECTSGKLAFFVIDPDDNFLGIADTNRLVPFEAMSFSTEDAIRLDANKTMVLNSPAAPGDLTTLDRPTCDRVYNAYSVDRVHRDNRRVTRNR